MCSYKKYGVYRMRLSFISFSVPQSTQHVFSHKVKNEGKPMTDQKSSGRCWIFACLNAMRIPLMEKLNIDECELSQVT